MRAFQGSLTLSGSGLVLAPSEAFAWQYSRRLSTNRPRRSPIAFPTLAQASSSSSPSSPDGSDADAQPSLSTPYSRSTNADPAERSMPYPQKRHLDQNGAATANPQQRKNYNKDNNKVPRVAGAPHFPQAMRSVTSDSENDENSWHPDLPPFPRMTPDDERLANEEGHFFRRLLEAGLVEPDGAVTALGNLRVAPMNATYIHLTINKMLSMNRRYQTVIAVVRDVGLYMGSVNIATAMHRLGRLVRSARAWNPNLPERMVAHPRYQYLLKRAEEYIDEMTPRALANFLWGMAALGDGRNTGIVLRVGRRFAYD
ncbi:hypothetical protein Ndes2526B_g08943 [Nannochloris sp. 'desiccata']